MEIKIIFFKLLLLSEWDIKSAPGITTAGMIKTNTKSNFQCHVNIIANEKRESSLGKCMLKKHYYSSQVKISSFGDKLL